MNPYPEYKDSGVAWLGQIPAHWKMQRAKYLFDERVEKGFPAEPLLAATQTKGVVPKTHYESRTVTAQKDLHLLKLVEPGDFVISLRSFQGGIEYAHYRGIISPAYTILQPSPRATVTRDYFEFFFKSQTFVNSLTLFVTGIREGQNIDYERLSRAALPVPPAEEQTAMGRFLRLALAKVNRLIRTKRRLIELLQEQKQALIHQAVTRGLDSNVRLKPSGVEWLGDIPEHWTVQKLGRFAKVQTGITLGKVYTSETLLTRPYLRVANVQDGHLDLKKVTTVSVPLSEANGSKLVDGDVLMTEGGDIDKLGRGCIWHGEIPECLHQNHVFAVRADRQHLLPEYLVLMMTAPHGRMYFQLTAKKTTNLASTNSTTIKAFPLPLPNVEEQKDILDFVAVETATIETAITRSRSEIELIREYRTRLIADVVTGKLDVRGVALPEGDEVKIENDETDAEEDETESLEAGEETEE